jgi:hypothetical protein
MRRASSRCRVTVLTRRPADRPAHVGHLFGTLLNLAGLQDLGVDVMMLIAGWPRRASMFGWVGRENPRSASRI